MNEFLFKVKGLKRVMTYDELMVAGVQPRCIKIIDVKQRTTWNADFRTVKEKFR